VTGGRKPTNSEELDTMIRASWCGMAFTEPEIDMVDAACVYYSEVLANGTWTKTSITIMPKLDDIAKVCEGH
jgi:hypothetical protein